MTMKDEQIIREVVGRMADEAPSPLDVDELGEPLIQPRRPDSTRHQPMRRRVAAALGLTAVFVVAAVLLTRTPPDETTPVGTPVIIEGSLGPEPEFDPGSFGGEAALLPPSGELQPDIPETPPGVPDGEVVAVGGIPDTGLEVFTWESTDGETCIQIVGEGFSDSTCGIDSQDWVTDPSGIAPGTDFADPPGLFWTPHSSSGSETTDVVVATPVPDETSVVVFEANGKRMWQRPTERVWAFSVDPDTPRLIISAWSANQGHLATTMFLPREAIDPVEQGETQLEGSPEDLVEIRESHPIGEILSEGATTDEEFRQEAEDRGIRGEGCTDGGPPDYRFCIYVVDGTLVLVPFEGEPGVAARINDPGLVQDVVIPLDRTEPVGVRNLDGPDLDVHIEYLGEETGGMRITSFSDDQN